MNKIFTNIISAFNNMRFVPKTILALFQNKMIFLISIVIEAILLHFAKPTTLLITKV